MIISLPMILLITVLSFPLQVKTKKKKKSVYLHPQSCWLLTSFTIMCLNHLGLISGTKNSRWFFSASSSLLFSLLWILSTSPLAWDWCIYLGSLVMSSITISITLSITGNICSVFFSPSSLIPSGNNLFYLLYCSTCHV